MALFSRSARRAMARGNWRKDSNLITMADITTAIEYTSGTKIPSFAGFSDFDLDLSLSPPTSPNKPSSPLPTPSHESTPRSSKTPSLFSQSYSLSEGRPARKMTPTLMMPPSVAATVLRGSWPLVRHVGRGTPVDKTRRVEWGTLGGEEEEEVTEDGLLLRSASLDSVSRQSPPEWNLLLTSPSSSSSQPENHTFPRSRSRLFDEPPPELPNPVNTASPEEWTSLMQMVLKPSSESSDAEDRKDPGSPEQEPRKTDEPPPQTECKEGEGDAPVDDAAGREACLTPEEIRQLDMELGNNLGLNEALNLGLSLHGNMNIFTLDILPPEGRDTPSVYPPDDETPHASRPPSARALEDTSENNSASARTDEVAIDQPFGQGFKRAARSCWNKLVKALRRMHIQHVKQ
ncbi:hypothetical protein APHAL10511_000773 [Amanita phalloides]|nr:hypothetical protein APHAL10511_000773 [Amanita phalloides]